MGSSLSAIRSDNRLFGKEMAAIFDELLDRQISDVESLLSQNHYFTHWGDCSISIDIYD
ncbi:hypothetical protein Pla110_15360 [Polystyrenella longa]|uniref:Uncharacterized protein n=1 Tax=Polystyrenella longa TaxID=2528007 RepID=A0A518CKS3_9PLAN|nr:hypothetical protein Pla110_15360 [Polystyrenella longa]